MSAEMPNPAGHTPADDEALVVGPRVYLRHPRERDRSAWIELRRSSRAFLEPWEPVPMTGVDPFGDTGFDAYRSRCDESHTQRHLAFLHNGTLVGHIAMNQIVRGVSQNAILGYWIGEPFARQGLMTETIRLCLVRAFEHLGLHRVEANVIPRNEASCRTAERCGFRREGYSPRYLRIAGGWEDHVRYAMTAEDWAELRSQGRGNPNLDAHDLK